MGQLIPLDLPEVTDEIYEGAGSWIQCLYSQASTLTTSPSSSLRHRFLTTSLWTQKPAVWSCLAHASWIPANFCEDFSVQ